MFRSRLAPLSVLVATLAIALSWPVVCPADELGEKLASQVTIHRDEWGVPHIDGPTDASVAFGFAYAQAEDYFWQVEDTYVASVGRYAELYGEKGLEKDLLNHAFEIARSAQADFAQLSTASCRPSAARTPRA